MRVIGTGAALPTAIAGLIDFARVDERALPVATRHMLLMGCASLAYAAALLARMRGWAPAPAPELLPVGLSLLGFVLLALGGHFGATLAFRYGVGHAAPEEGR